jgi:DNA-binding FadR family transcriptional regulator
MGVKPKPITKAEMELFGITRWSKREALEDLERVGLIRFDQNHERMVPI